MHTNRQGLFDATTASRAVLRRAIGIYTDKLSPGSFGLVGQHVQEVAPTGIRDALGDVAARKTFDVQVFDGDQAKACRNLGRFLVLEIPALVRRVFVQAPDLARKLGILAASFFAPGAATLQRSELFLCRPGPAGVLDQLPSGQGGKGLQAHVDPDFRPTIGGGLHIGQFQLKDDVPMVEIVSLEDRRLDLGLVGQGSVLEDTDQADVLDVQPTIFQAQSVTVGELERLVPAPALESRIARFLSRLDAAKETIKALAQSAQGLLQRREVTPGCILVKLTNATELVGLVIIADADTAALPRFTSFGKCVVVDRAVYLKHLVEQLGLHTVRVQAKLI